MIDLENRNYITLIECISSASEIIPLMLLVSGVNILYKQCQHDNLDGDIVIDKTETSYANNDTAFEQLQHFIYHTQNKKRGAWFLLIIDSYGSYITLPFYNLTTENKIFLFCLPLYSTHFTQSLNVGIFQSFKHYYTDAIDKAVC